MTCITNETDKGLLISFKENISQDNLKQVSNVIKGLCFDYYTRITFDLQGVSQMSFKVLGILVNILIWINERGKNVTVINVRPELCSLIDFSNIENLTSYLNGENKRY